MFDLKTTLFLQFKKILLRLVLFKLIEIILDFEDLSLLLYEYDN